MRWETHCFINGNRKHCFINIKNEAFSFKTKNSPLSCDDLQNFEKELFDTAKHIKFKKKTDSFQTHLKQDISKIKTLTNVF